jgi:hypothetical protein
MGSCLAGIAYEKLSNFVCTDAFEGSSTLAAFGYS